MLAIGLPDFGPVQNNVSFNSDRGVTRGIHTEPWDKFISLATGRIFGAWVDMREGETFGATFTLEMDTSVAVFVPRGVGNSYQVLEDATAYTYLVNDHWRPGVTYPALALGDPTVAIDWPIPLGEAIISEKDQNAPALDPSTAMAPKKTLIVGALGQLGRALFAAHPDADRVDLVRRARASPRSTSPTPRPSPPGRGTSTPSCSTRRRTPPSTPPRPPRAASPPGPPTPPDRRPSPGSPASTASRSCTTPRTTSSTAPPPSTPATPRTSRCRRSASTRSPRRRATSPSAWRRATTCCARRG